MVVVVREGVRKKHLVAEERRREAEKKKIEIEREEEFSTRITQSSRETIAIRRSTANVVNAAELSACLDTLVASSAAIICNTHLRVLASARTHALSRASNVGGEDPRKQAADYLTGGIPIARTIGANCARPRPMIQIAVSRLG